MEIRQLNLKLLTGLNSDFYLLKTQSYAIRYAHALSHNKFRKEMSIRDGLKRQNTAYAKKMMLRYANWYRQTRLFKAP